jgi:hypothetical protein
MNKLIVLKASGHMASRHSPGRCNNFDASSEIKQEARFCLSAHLHGIITPRFSQLTPQPLIRIVVANKLLGLGIPLQFPTKPE